MHFNKHIFIPRRISRPRLKPYFVRHKASIKLNLSYLSLFSRFDRLMIFNDLNYNYGVHCGEKTGHTVLVNGSYVVIRFQSDENYQTEGFLLDFTAVQIGKYEARTFTVENEKGDQALYFSVNCFSRKVVPWTGHSV